MNSSSISAICTIILLCAVSGYKASVHAAEKQEIPTVEEFMNESPACEKTACDRDVHLLQKAATMQTAIQKFKTMGVGVSMFEQSLQNARQLIADGRPGEANEALGHLDESLRDQQKRFYTGKIQSWHSDRMRMIANRVAAKGGHIAYSPVSSELSRSAHNTVSKKSVNGTPVIYPIAR